MLGSPLPVRERAHTCLQRSEALLSVASMGTTIPAHSVFRFDSGLDIMRVESRFFAQKANEESWVTNGYSQGSGHCVVGRRVYRKSTQEVD